MGTSRMLGRWMNKPSWQRKNIKPIVRERSQADPVPEPEVIAAPVEAIVPAPEPTPTEVLPPPEPVIVIAGESKEEDHQNRPRKGRNKWRPLDDPREEQTQPE